MRLRVMFPDPDHNQVLPWPETARIPNAGEMMVLAGMGEPWRVEEVTWVPRLVAGEIELEVQLRMGWQRIARDPADPAYGSDFLDRLP